MIVQKKQEHYGTMVILCQIPRHTEPTEPSESSHSSVEGQVSCPTTCAVAAICRYFWWEILDHVGLLWLIVTEYQNKYVNLKKTALAIKLMILGNHCNHRFMANQ